MRSHFSFEIPFIGHRRQFLGLSCILVVLAVVGLLTRGLVFGIEFRGGTEMDFRSTGDVAIEQMRGALESVGEGSATVQTAVTEGEPGFLVRSDTTDPATANAHAADAAGSLGLAADSYTVTTIGPDWQHKGPATGFDADAYYDTMGKGYFIEELLKKHSAIMDRYDPEHRVGLIVDEWGTWFDVEPGTNPGFLYQQNTMRDAMLAGLTLNCFNKHAERVHMANIAQLINVLQAVALTDGERMILTPTYHVFDMYSVHQGAQLVQSTIATGTRKAPNGFEVPEVSESASVDSEGHLNVTLCNMALDKAMPIEMLIDQGDMMLYEGKLLTGAMGDHNTFEVPTKVESTEFDAVEWEKTASGSEVRFELPPCSVVRLTFGAVK